MASSTIAGGIDTEDAANVVAALAGIVATYYLIRAEVESRPRPRDPPGSYRLSTEQVRQLDLGREVRLYRFTGAPDLALSAEPVDDDQEA
jgi:hypothetical protein